MFDSSIEKKLSNELDKLGISSQNNYKVPTGFDKKQVYCDFYINSPTRAIIEIKTILHETSKNKKRKIGRYSHNQMRRMLKLFNPSPVGILVTNHQNPTDLLKDIDDSNDIYTIKINIEDKKSIEDCAKEIKRILVKHSSLKPKLFKQKPVGKGDLYDTYVSLGQIMSWENYERIMNEINFLEEEINCGHLTAAALRVGRTLEFIIYVCAKSWGVPINNRTNEAMESLNKKYEMFQSDYIEYSYSGDDDKEKKRKKLQKTLKILSTKIQEIGFDLDKKPVVKKSRSPLNVQTLIRDIRKKYVRNESIINEIDLLLNEGELKTLIQIRNNSAHAKSSLNNHETTEKEIYQMKEGLRMIIFRLVNIEYLIKEANL